MANPNRGKAKQVSHNILSGTDTPIPNRVHFNLGNGRYLAITPLVDGIEIHYGGLVGEERIVVLPDCSNVVRIVTVPVECTRGR